MTGDSVAGGTLPRSREPAVIPTPTPNVRRSSRSDQHQVVRLANCYNRFSISRTHRTRKADFDPW
jgi:hypothetical protein